MRWARERASEREGSRQSLVSQRQPLSECNSDRGRADLQELGCERAVFPEADISLLVRKVRGGTREAGGTQQVTAGNGSSTTRPATATGGTSASTRSTVNAPPPTLPSPPLTMWQPMLSTTRPSASGGSGTSTPSHSRRSRRLSPTQERRTRSCKPTPVYLQWEVGKGQGGSKECDC